MVVWGRLKNSWEKKRGERQRREGKIYLTELRVLLKCCAQYVRKFGKQQWPQDWKRSVFLPIPKKGYAKEVQITIQLHSFHMLARLCSKSFKLGFSSTWTENFQMYKMDLEKAKESESNCQHPLDHRKSKGIPKKKKQTNKKKQSTPSLTMKKPLTLWIPINCGNFLEMDYQTTLPVS